MQRAIEKLDITRETEPVDAAVGITSIKQYDKAALAKQPVIETGTLPTVSYMSRLDSHVEGARQAKLLKRRGSLPADAPPDFDGKLTDPKVEVLFEADEKVPLYDRVVAKFDELKETANTNLRYEHKLRGLPSTTGHGELSMADDIRVLQHRRGSRANRLAQRDLESVVGPLKGLGRGKKFTAAWRSFERITKSLRLVIRSAQESYERSDCRPARRSGSACTQGGAGSGVVSPASRQRDAG